MRSWCEGHVLHLAKPARDAGLDGSVASPREIGMLRIGLGDRWVLVTPGIRPAKSADADGVGSNWVGFSGMDEVKPPLQIPAALDVVAIVPFGYPARPVGRGKKQRKPLRDIAHRERHGQPFG